MIAELDPVSKAVGGAHFRRLLLIGLDGATFDVLGPLMADGTMPNLKRLVEQGTSGILESTKPPITPAAWTTFMTGKGPGKHGIIDFVRYDPTTDTLGFNNNTKIDRKAKTIWQILSDKGFQVGSINVPMTFPPEEVKGFMISGFDTPSGKDFTYPRELQDEILREFPDYTHEKRWERKVGGGQNLFEKNLEYIRQSFDRGYRLARSCGDRYGWDVLMVLFKLVDNLQHKAWRYIDPRTRDEDPARRDLVIQCWADLDRSIGKLMALAEERDATVMVMSDHGHGSLEGKAQPNLLLARWGHLGLRSTLARARTRGGVWWHRLTGSRNGFNNGNGHGLDHDLAIDWSRTKACVLHAGIYGFLYINLKGRQPNGIVGQSEYDALRRELKARFLAARCKGRDGSEMAIFPEVFLTEDLYGCRREEHPWMPDLLLAPAPGLAVVKKIRGRRPVRWLPLARMEGTHRLEGIFIAQGPGVARGKRVRAHIADIAPTMLAGLGQPVLADMQGTVLRGIFEPRDIRVEYEPPQERKLDAELTPVLSDAQVREVSKRLGDLGYMD